VEIPVSYEITADAPKIDGPEEIFYINIENISFVPMLVRIGNDRSPSLETMSNAWMLVFVASVVRLIDLLDAIL